MIEQNKSPFFRYFELVTIHGKLDPLVNVDLRPEKRVKVRFTCGSNSEVRSVDVYRTVCDLKTKLEPFAGFSAAKMRLFYVDQDLRDIQVSKLTIVIGIYRVILC